MSFEKGNKCYPSQTIGLIKFYEITNPGAGHNISWTIPSNLLIEPFSCQFRLVTDATVANRRILINYTDNVSGNRIIRYTSTYDHTASLTRDYNCAINLINTEQYSTEINMPLPHSFINGSGTLEISAFNLQAGDVFTNGRVVARVWTVA